MILFSQNTKIEINIQNNLKTKEIKEFYKNSNDFLKKNPSKELIGIPYLNPHLPRSILINKYKINLNFFKKIFNFLLRFFTLNKNFNYVSKGNYRYIILSHLVSYDNLKYDKDFYFGNLAKKLDYNKVLFVLIDHIDFNKKFIENKIQGNYIILSKRLNFLSEVNLLLKTSIKIFYYSFFQQNINFLSYQNILRSVDNQRISIQVKKILEKYNFKEIFFTYEGNPYEKLVCYEAQKLKKNIRKIGYQFGVIRKFQFSLFSFINKKFDPDVILTIGKYNKKLLISKLNKRFKINNFGLLNKEAINLSLTKNFKKSKKLRVLVMPEGITDEIHLFLNFCRMNPNKKIEFTFRLHPIFFKNKIINKQIKKIGGNVKISKNKLEYDIKNNAYLLYRGTGAVMNAVNSGLIPIYLHKKNQVSLDPFFEVNKNHIVEYNNSLLEFIIKNLDKKNFKQEIIKIKRFSKTFYDKPKFKELLKFIKKN